jgi:hypothetical protein
VNIVDNLRVTLFLRRRNGAPADHWADVDRTPAPHLRFHGDFVCGLRLYRLDLAQSLEGDGANCL